MLAEWIRILGLDGNDPPWEGEPREIRAIVQSRGEDMRVRITDIAKKKKGTFVCVVKIRPEIPDGDDISPFWLEIDQLISKVIIY